MSSTGGPSGRSPFTGRRSRPRMSVGSMNSNNMADTSAEAADLTSPFFTSAATRQSPPTSGKNRRRFFEERGGGGVLATGIPPPKNTSSTRKQQQEDAVVLLDGMNLTKLRHLAQDALGGPNLTPAPNMAVFYGSILYSKTHLPSDALLYAQALALNGEHRRCVSLLEKAELLLVDLEATLLAAQSLAAIQEWDECLAVLEQATEPLDDDDEGGWKTLVSSVPALEQPDARIHPVARLCLWRGRAYDETSHPTRAALYWKRALAIDATCVEALDCMLERAVVTPVEAHDLLSTLKLEPGMEWLLHVYLARLDLPHDHSKENKEPNSNNNTSLFGGLQDASTIEHVATPHHGDVLGSMWQDKQDEDDDNGDVKPPAKPHFSTETKETMDVDSAFDKLWTEHKLDQSPEVLSLAAIRSFRRHNLHEALEYCQALAQVDPLCPTCSFVHVATLVGLNKKRLLFGLAHEWVEANPKSARSWFAVGAYYYACGRYHVAQRHFCRATRLDPKSSDAWIAFGCAFAACDESDQALASFRAAQRLSPAQHASLLYMGMEYLRTNHLVLANHFLTAALESSGGDPLCFHELGVAAWNKKEYPDAILYFDKCLRTLVESNSSRGPQGQRGNVALAKTTAECIDLIQDAFWEPTLFNLGQCYRKTRHFAEATHCLEKCLALCPGNASTYSALGFTKHLTGNLDGAIELYHQALSRKPDDQFSSDMLNRALEEALSSMSVQDQTMADVAESSPTPPEPSFVSPPPNRPRTRQSVRRQQLQQQQQQQQQQQRAASSDDNLSFASSDVDMSMT